MCPCRRSLIDVTAWLRRDTDGGEGGGAADRCRSFTGSCFHFKKKKKKGASWEDLSVLLGGTTSPVLCLQRSERFLSSSGPARRHRGSSPCKLGKQSALVTTWWTHVFPPQVYSVCLSRLRGGPSSASALASSQTPEPLSARDAAKTRGCCRNVWMPDARTGKNSVDCLVPYQLSVWQPGGARGRLGLDRRHRRLRLHDLEEQTFMLYRRSG